MKSLELFMLVGEIDPELIYRAEAPVPFYKKPRMRVLAVAAALAVLLAVSTVMGSFLLVQRTEKYVRDNYPAYDGTPLHAVQILLTEDENIISSLLDDSERKLLGDAFAALRQSLKKGNGNEGEVTIGSEEQTTEPNENQTDGEQESQTQPRPWSISSERKTAKPFTSFPVSALARTPSFIFRRPTKAAPWWKLA